MTHRRPWKILLPDPGRKWQCAKPGFRAFVILWFLTSGTFHVPVTRGLLTDQTVVERSENVKHSAGVLLQQKNGVSPVIVAGTNSVCTCRELSSINLLAAGNCV